MKTLLLLVCMGLAAAVGPQAAREFHRRFIAVDQFGHRLDQLLTCPACRKGSVTGDTSGPTRNCHRCGHAWIPQRLPGFRTPTDEAQTIASAPLERQ
jgi:hypothetical protein